MKIFTLALILLPVFSQSEEVSSEPPLRWQAKTPEEEKYINRIGDYRVPWSFSEHLAVKTVPNVTPEFTINRGSKIDIRIIMGSMDDLFGLHIDPEGKVQFYQAGFVVPSFCDFEEFQISEELTQSIRNELIRCKILTLDDEYDAGVDDGLSISIFIFDGVNRKKVICRNYFPIPVRVFLNQVHEQLLMGARFEVAKETGPDLKSRQLTTRKEKTLDFGIKFVRELAGESTGSK